MGPNPLRLDVAINQMSNRRERRSGFSGTIDLRVGAVVGVGGLTMNNSFESKANQRQMFRSRPFDKGIIMKQDPVIRTY